MRTYKKIEPDFLIVTDYQTDLAANSLSYLFKNNGPQ